MLDKHTNEAKDVTDGGDEYNKKVDQEEETKGNADVSKPVERLVSEEKLKQGPADLQTKGNKQMKKGKNL